MDVPANSSSLEFGNGHHEPVSKKRKSVGKIGFLIAVVGFLLLACIVFILFFQGNISLPEAQPVKNLASIHLDDVIFGAYEPTRFNGSWTSDDEILYKNNYGYFTLFNVTSKTARVLLREPSLMDKVQDVQISADKKYLLVTVNSQRIYRHSSYFQALIYDIQFQKLLPITNENGEPLVLQLIKWAPRGNGFAYVYNNNIYYRPIAAAAATEVDVQLTFTGNASFYNGVCDWVYEEEIFSDTSAMWFSPDGDKLAFASFDDSNTDVMSITYYGEPSTIDSQYPKNFNLRYPKPGRVNPAVFVTVVDLEKLDTLSESSMPMQLPTIFLDPILSTATWITNEDLCLILMNRVQNKALILSCNPTDGTCTTLIHKHNKIGWLNMYVPPLFSADGGQMIFIDSWDQGNDLGGYRHITHYDITRNRTIPLTQGRLTITEILSWDEPNNAVYYLATEENKPMKQHLYKVRIPDNDTLTKSECLSCINDPACTYASAMFSKTNSYFVQTCAGPGVPVISIFNKYNRKVFTWDDNCKLRKKLNNVTLPEKQFLKFPVGDNMEAQVLLMFPPHMDKSGKKKYPLLVNVYGGPDSNQVFNRFRISWEMYYSTNRDVIIALIDGRGSGLKGDDMLFANYRKLGSAEIEDQISVTKQLQTAFSFIDKKRTAIWGWSYGGYATGMVLASDSNRVFKCGVSVAPVTDWIYYDSMYTERFLGLPTEKDNKAGYISSSLVKRAQKLAGKNYMLVHGTLDDNVHYQQSMMLARTLELNDVLFKQQSYPDEAHSLAGVRFHFYHTLEAFLTECFAT